MPKAPPDAMQCSCPHASDRTPLNRALARASSAQSGARGAAGGLHEQALANQGDCISESGNDTSEGATACVFSRQVGRGAPQ